MGYREKHREALAIATETQCSTKAQKSLLSLLNKYYQVHFKKMTVSLYPTSHHFDPAIIFDYLDERKEGEN